MKYIAEKVQAGVLDLSKIPMYKLKQMASETDCRRDLDCLGCEIMYRKDDE